MSTAVVSAHAAASATTVTSSTTSVVKAAKDEEVPDSKTPAAANVTAEITNCVPSAAGPIEKATKAETDPLPPDLHLILNEVARTGKCPWLSWNGKDPPEAPIPPDIQALLSSSSTSAAGGGGKSSGGTGSSRSVFAKHRPSSSAFTSFSSRSGTPVRKKLRNGIHSNRRRIGDNGSCLSGTGGTAAAAAAGRKRPFSLTSSTCSTFSVSSIGSGRTSGSEVEDSTQYECDSEGTSATTNSELSVERRAARKRIIVQTSPGLTPSEMSAPVCRYKTLQEAVRSAIGLVLDYSYRNRGGYRLSPAEIRIHAAAVAAQSAASNASALEDAGNGGSGKENNPELELEPPSAEKTFQQRRRRLLALLGGDSDSSDHHHFLSSSSHLGTGVDFPDGPPFTIQRIAEVLVAPERYYKQTHKLCNCLEKLLLVTSPASSFGEGNGNGNAAVHDNGADNELNVALEEKAKPEPESRHKRLKRRMSSSSDVLGDDNAQKSTLQKQRQVVDMSISKSMPEEMTEERTETLKAARQDQAEETASTSKSSKEILEAAARAQLRSKFDHVGIDPHSVATVDGIAGNRGMTSSPPPPGLAMSGASGLTPHGAAVSAFPRHVGEHPCDSPTDTTPLPSEVHQNPMPFFAAANENAKAIPAIHASQNIHLLHMNHEAALSAASLGDSPVEFVINSDANVTKALSAPTASVLPSASDVADLDVEPGRSSASNSDVDSESDDLSLDDSASDRSDGSDSGHSEPFTAARVMALNRIQQQRSMQNRTNQTTLHYQHGYGFRPPLDTEYQSGDSIDSTMAEDSCGSDSSSASDLAD